MKKFSYLLSVVSCALFIGNIVYAQSDKLRVEFLLERNADADLARRQPALRTLPREKRIDRSHISVLEVTDEQRKLLGGFVNLLGSMYNPLNTAFLESVRATGRVPQFVGNAVTPYGPFWCLESSKENGALADFRQMVVNAVTAYGDQFFPAPAKKTGFQRKTPGQTVSGMASKTRQDFRSYLQYTRGFPHISLAKGGAELENLFDPFQGQDISLGIDGVNVIYSLEGSNVSHPIYVKMFFGRKPRIACYSPTLVSLDGMPSKFSSMEELRNEFNSRTDDIVYELGSN